MQAGGGIAVLTLKRCHKVTEKRINTPQKDCEEMLLWGEGCSKLPGNQKSLFISIVWYEKIAYLCSIIYKFVYAVMNGIVNLDEL